MVSIVGTLIIFVMAHDTVTANSNVIIGETCGNICMYFGDPQPASEEMRIRPETVISCVVVVGH